MVRGEPPYTKALHNCRCTACVSRYGPKGYDYASKKTVQSHLDKDALAAAPVAVDPVVNVPGASADATPDPGDLPEHPQFLPNSFDETESLPSAPEAAVPAPDPTAHIHLDHLLDARLWVEDLKLCERGKTGLSPKALDAIQNPPQTPLELDEDTDFSLELFIACSGSSQQTYRDAREAVLRRHPDQPILSYEQCEKKLAEVTGVHPTEYHICINTCIAYVGRFSELTHCIKCNEPRYDAVKSEGNKLVPRHRMIHTPVAAQLQAMRRSPVGSKLSQYRSEATKKLLDELGTDSVPDVLEDIIHGEDYIAAARDGRIGPNDMVIASTIDGAQLYASKGSDCWFLCFVVFEFGPDMRYTKKLVLIDSMFPGPNPPKHMYSFMFASLQNISAVMNMNGGAGMPVWDAARNELYNSRLFVAFNLADGPGQCTVSGLVGHKGAHGCRLFCDLKGRHKPESPAYYPALLKPKHYTVDGCNHPNVDPQHLKPQSPAEFQAVIDRLERAPNQNQHDAIRKATGVYQASIFEGLPERNRFSIPVMFPLDLMHILSLNLADLMVSLWRGEITCDASDDKKNWAFAVLVDRVWQMHGDLMRKCGARIPGSHDCAPRDIALKINSQYKAKEHQTHLYILCPGLLYGILPMPYWKHFCILVRAVRIIHQRKVTRAQLLHAHKLFLKFAVQFEVLYVQFRYDRLHMIRPCVHTLVHMSPEALRVGPLPLTAQWTLERVIGLVTSQIRQDSNPFMNIQLQGVRTSQIHALKLLRPDLDAAARQEASKPRSWKLFKNGYALLPKHDRSAGTCTTTENRAIDAFYHAQGRTWHSRTLRRWARALLPNMQVVRSLWKDASSSRAASCVRVSICHERSTV
jgi:hypothetical protein